MIWRLSLTLNKNIQFTFLSIFLASDYDECSNNANDCHTESTCSNEEGSFSCTCKSGYDGDGVTCKGKFDYLWSKNQCTKTVRLQSIYLKARNA